MAPTLLLADDSLTIRRVIELTFAEEDVHVVAVADGDAAIALVDAEPPDIVLADVGMPGKSGYDVASYVKHSPRLSHIPVLLLTGAFEPVDQRKASESGCDGVLAKPFEPQLVIARVRELLEHAHVGEAGTSAPASPDEPPSVARPRAWHHSNPAPSSSWNQPVAAAPSASSPLHDRDEAAESAMGDFFDQLDAAFAKLPDSHSDADSGGRNVAPVDHAAFRARRPPRAVDDDAGDWDLILPAIGDPKRPLAREPLDSHNDNDSHSDNDSHDDTETETDVGQSTPVDAGSGDTPVFLQPFAPAPPAGASDDKAASPMVADAATLPPTRPSRRSGPALAQAFAALLEAEHPGAPAADLSAWIPSAPEVSDELIEQVAQRVLARLTDQVVRDTVATIVSSVAERLVLEEIARIKAAIK